MQPFCGVKHIIQNFEKRSESEKGYIFVCFFATGWRNNEKDKNAADLCESKSNRKKENNIRIKGSETQAKAIRKRKTG